jgi:GWxTD domain-containing protein
MLREPHSPAFEVEVTLQNPSPRFRHVSLSTLAFLTFCLAVFCVAALTPSPAFAFISEKTLTPIYRHWIHQEVNYIITRAERNEFLALKTDDERDKFIERFWELRNPSPGAPANSYKEDIYKRIEYANDHFSTNGSNDGWDTDMGRIYITLGPPQQKGRYVTQAEVRGMEIWFYSMSNPALPPNFNIVFFEKDFGDFRLYSPYIDGPQKLISSHYAENGRVEAVKQIDKILGREVARTTLSLIPGEPVNLNDANSTMQSDLMLGTIKDLANHPFNVEALNLKRAMRESVSHRVVLTGEFLNVLTVPLRDRQGVSRLNYVLRLNSASDFAVAKDDNRYYISLEVATHVFTEDHKPLFQLHD